MNRAAVAKAFALCSSLLLAGCFVAYRQNHAQDPGNKPPAGKALLPGSKNPNRTTVFPSSKSIDAILLNPNRTNGHSHHGDDGMLPEPRQGTDFIAPDGIPRDPEVNRILNPQDVPLQKSPSKP